MADKKIRIGIIGVGQIGKEHIENYKNIPGAQVTSAADVDENEVKRVSKIYGIPRIFTDFRRLLQQKDIDAVDICLHNNLHMPVTVEALEAGKHVYCEKPMAGSYRDAFAMMEASKQTGKKLNIQLSSLFSRETKAAKTFIEKGYLGKIYYARSAGFRRRGRPYVDGYGSPLFVKKKIAGGGALYDVGVYHITNILYLIGNPEVMRISGKVYQKTAIDPERKKISKYDVEEFAIGLVRFKNGMTLEIIESWAIHLNPFEGSCLAGNKGGIRLDPFSYHTNIGDLQTDTTIDMNAANFRWHSLRKNADAYDSPQQHWIAALQGRVKLLPAAEIALNTMLISEGIFLSSRLNREVMAEEVERNSKSSALKV